MLPDSYSGRYNSQNYALAMLAAGETIVWACLFYVFPALLLRWESAFSWSKIQLTGAITLALFISAICSPLFGRLIDRGVGPVMMTLGALTGGVCVFLMSYTSALWHLYVLWAIIGACLAACLYEPCFALLTRAFGKEAKRRIIIVTLVAGFASTISFPAAHHLANHWGWPVVTQVFGLTVIFIGAPLLYFGATAVEQYGVLFGQQTHVSAPNRGVAKNHTKAYLGQPVFRYLAIAFAMLALVHGATLHHLLHILGDRGLPLGSSVLVASLIGPMQVFGRLVITALQNKLGHMKIACGCFMFIGSAMVFLYLARFGLSFAILFAVVFGGGYGVVSIIRPVIARDLLGDEDFGAKSGLLAFFYLIGSASSPYIGSLVWAAGGYNLLMILLFCSAVTGLALMYMAMRGSRELERRST